jgi:hypothetical protein
MCDRKLRGRQPTIRRCGEARIYVIDVNSVSSFAFEVV